MNLYVSPKPFAHDLNNYDFGFMALRCTGANIPICATKEGAPGADQGRKTVRHISTNT